MRTVLLMQCLTEINEVKDARRVPVTDKCMREVSRVSGSMVFILVIYSCENLVMIILNKSAKYFL